MNGSEELDVKEGGKLGAPIAASEDDDLWPAYAIWQFGWTFVIGGLLLLGTWLKW